MWKENTHNQVGTENPMQGPAPRPVVGFKPGSTDVKGSERNHYKANPVPNQSNQNKMIVIFWGGLHFMLCFFISLTLIHTELSLWRICTASDWWGLCNERAFRLKLMIFAMSFCRRSLQFKPKCQIQGVLA